MEAANPAFPGIVIFLCARGNIAIDHNWIMVRQPLFKNAQVELRIQTRRGRARLGQLPHRSVQLFGQSWLGFYPEPLLGVDPMPDLLGGTAVGGRRVK